MKVGDLVREDWAGGRLGVVVSKIRRSTPLDNHQLGVMSVSYTHLTLPTILRV